MPFDDLDLEFEDEEESKKKKSDAVHVDVDLEFHSGEGAKGKAPVNKPVAPTTSPNIAKPPPKVAIVQNLDEARKAQTSPSIKPPPISINNAPVVSGTSALKPAESFDVESVQVVQLREQMKKVEFEAEVKVAVAEYKTELLSELLSDMKLMDHQIGQLLARINAKHPDMKQEALMIKKLLADFTAKKRK